MTHESSHYNQYVYLGSFTAAGGRGITTATLDSDDGTPCPVHHTDSAVPDPSYLLRRGGLLYAVCEREAGAATVLSLTEPDVPRPLGEPVPTGGAAPTHLAVAAGRLFTANYAAGSVSALPLCDDGTPEGPAQVHRHHGAGPVTERQEGPHAHAVVPDPSGRWLLSVDLGSDSVWVYPLSSGPLGEPREVSLRAGSGPRHLVFASGGTRAYVINELDPTVTVCHWDARDGVLEPVAESDVLPAGRSGEDFPSEIVLRRDGRLAWVAVRGADVISTLALEESGRVAEVVTTVPSGGHWPRDLALHPSGRWLYVANERSGDVTWFTVDEATGVPRRAGAIDAPAVSCVVFG